jgi:hypothetical protein
MASSEDVPWLSCKPVVFLCAPAVAYRCEDGIDVLDCAFARSVGGKFCSIYLQCSLDLSAAGFLSDPSAFEDGPR